MVALVKHPLPRLVFFRSEYERMVRLVELIADMGIEVGGVLFGKRVLRDVVIVRVVEPGPRAEMEDVSFAPDVEYSQRILDEYRAGWDVYWIGVWHLHPSYLDKPSRGDVKQMKRLVDAPETLDEFVLVVANWLEPGEVKLSAYYMDISKKLDKIPYAVVDNRSRQGRRLRRALLHRKEVELSWPSW